MFVADLIMIALALPFIILVVAGYVLIALLVNRGLRERLAQSSMEAALRRIDDPPPMQAS